MTFCIFILIGVVYLGPEFVKDLRQRQYRSHLDVMCVLIRMS